MSDPRLTPANDRVMADHLPDDGSGRARVIPQPMLVHVPVLDLLRHPDGPRDRQLLLGDEVSVIETLGDVVFVQSRKDGYVGYVQKGALALPDQATTHVVTAAATHSYTAADLKSPDRLSLSFGSRVAVISDANEFCETAHGHIPQQHLAPLDFVATDPVAVAELFLGTPYLWGGNSRWGIDCSGLVQAACLACGLPCPGDSDQQQAGLGQPLPEGTPPERGDLLFWKGHVAWVADDTLILHANAHSMSVTFEDRVSAVHRIAAAGEGPVTAHKRL